MSTTRTTFRHKLECGHWSIPLTEAQAIAARDVGMAACGALNSCGVKGTTGKLKASGKTMSQWDRERSEAVERMAQSPTNDGAKPVRSFPGGLLVREFPGERCMWWCRWCHGKRSNAAKHLASTCGLDDLPSQWAAHTTTGSHMRERKLRDDVSRLMDAI